MRSRAEREDRGARAAQPAGGCAWHGLRRWVHGRRGSVAGAGEGAGSTVQAGGQMAQERAGPRQQKVFTAAADCKGNGESRARERSGRARPPPCFSVHTRMRSPNAHGHAGEFARWYTDTHVYAQVCICAPSRTPKHTGSYGPTPSPIGLRAQINTPGEHGWHVMGAAGVHLLEAGGGPPPRHRCCASGSHQASAIKGTKQGAR